MDAVIEADSYKVDAKFFTFLKDKEVVRSLKVDVVVQIRRMDDDETDDEEGEPARTTEGPLARSPASGDAALDQLMAALPDDTELHRLLADIPEVDIDDLLNPPDDR